MLAGVQHTVLHAVNDRTGAQEEQRFEEGVGHEVEGGCGVCTNSQRGDHVAQLRYGGIGQYPFDVILRHSNGGSE